VKLAGWDVNYPGLLSVAEKAGVQDLPAYLADMLPDRWCAVT
jgi:hypothetical protein